ncbi:hypothetical protein D5278_16150 [bacterium 1XD21-13]|nr:hypothetical protein [bacterium 1XD21-13]
MFSTELQERLKLLDDHLVAFDENQFVLKEKRTEGKAELTLKLCAPCILFCKLEDKKLKYFKNQKCADYLLYEYKENHWEMHIFELKRSIGLSQWEQIKEQAKGAIQNGMAIAGFLGIEVSLDKVHMYSAYRNDKINDYANPGKQRYQMHKRVSLEHSQKRCDWNAPMIELDFLGKREFHHHKVQLNPEDGKGSYAVA